VSQLLWALLALALFAVDALIFAVGVILMAIGLAGFALLTPRRGGAWDDKAATRALAAQEQRAELTARRRTGRRA
jgi:hypothetical protein